MTASRASRRNLRAALPGVPTCPGCEMPREEGHVCAPVPFAHPERAALCGGADPMTWPHPGKFECPVCNAPPGKACERRVDVAEACDDMTAIWYAVARSADENDALPAEERAEVAERLAKERV